MNIQPITATNFAPLISPVISVGIFAIAYLNWRVRTVRLRFCQACQWRDTAVNPEGTVKIMVNLENHGDEGFKVLRIGRIYFSTNSQLLPEPEVIDLEMERYGKETFNIYSISLLPDGITTYIIAITVSYRSLEGFLGSDRFSFGIKKKLFLFECSPGCLSHMSSSTNQDKPYLSEVVEKNQRQAIVKLLPHEFN